MLTLWEMYNNPIEQLRKTSQDFKLLAKVLDYMEEAEDGSLSDVLMDKELDAAYAKIKCKKLVNNYIAPKSTLSKKQLSTLKDMFKKDKEEYSNTSPIPRSWSWRGTSYGYI